jgi:hypothetical protein
MKSKAEELAEQYQDKGCIEGQLFFENVRTRWAKQDFLAGYSARDEEVSLLKQEVETARREFKIMKDATEKLQAKLDEAVKVLSFYASEMNYSLDDYHGISGEMRKRCVLYGDCEERNDFYSYAGFRARQFLKQTKGDK